jgi:hypothetical protein
MKKLVCAAAVVALLSGCAGHVPHYTWAPGPNAKGPVRETTGACEMVALQMPQPTRINMQQQMNINAEPYHAPSGGFAGGLADGLAAGAALRASFNDAAREGRMFNACMVANGMVQVPRNPQIGAR